MSDLASIPYNEAAELYVMGFLLSDSRAIDYYLAHEAHPSWFSPNYRLIMEVIDERIRECAPVDLPHVFQVLLSLHGEERAPMSTLQHAVDSATTFAHFEDVLLSIRNLHALRNMDEALVRARDSLRSEGSVLDPTVICPDIVSEISEAATLQNETEVKPDYEQVGTRVINTFYGYDRERPAFIPSRWTGLQEKTMGKPKGKLTLLAARPGKGKTTCAMNEAAYDAESNYRVGVISLEMTMEELITLMACEREGLDAFKLRSGRFSPEEIDTFMNSCRNIRNLPLYIEEARHGMTINQIVSWIRRAHRVHQIDIVYIDYIQLIRGKDSANRPYEVGSWAATLARLAKELNISIYALCQLSRAQEPPAGTPKEKLTLYKPRLTHLKESGGLEENAYIVLLLDQDYEHESPEELSSPGHERAYYCIDVAKHRGGPTGEVKMIFYKSRQRLEMRQPGFAQIMQDSYQDRYQEEEVPDPSDPEPEEVQEDFPF